MAEYLDRAVILSMPEPLKSNRHYQTYNLDDAYEQGWSDALRRIEPIPSADVFPVMHGRWVHLGGDEWCCSACGFVISTEGSWEKPTKKYCEDCGAKWMEGRFND